MNSKKKTILISRKDRYHICKKFQLKKINFKDFYVYLSMHMVENCIYKCNVKNTIFATISLSEFSNRMFNLRLKTLRILEHYQAFLKKP